MLSHVDYQFSTVHSQQGDRCSRKEFLGACVPRDILEILRPLNKEDKRQIELKLDGGKGG